MQNVTKNLHEDSPYRPLVDGTMKMMNRVTNAASSATSLDLAKVFYRAATDRQPKRRYYYSWSDRMMAHFARTHAGTFHRMMTLVSKHLV